MFIFVPKEQEYIVRNQKLSIVLSFPFSNLITFWMSFITVILFHILIPEPRRKCHLLFSVTPLTAF